MAAKKKKKRKSSSASSVPRFSPPIPILRSFDEMKTREFYVDFLGFKVDWEHRFEKKSPLYMQVSLGPCAIQLSEHFGDGTPGTKVKIETAELDLLQRELLGKKYRHSRPGIVDHDWGERSMGISDPSGNTIIFFARIAR